jgi:CRISPR-associated endonuclease/helicase Cas3
MTDFAAFFGSLWGKDPFPWQTMLANQAASGDWPEAINLPTASGKTACLDAAIFALAATADAHVSEKRIPRRVWFVVDRRIVVDEAFERGKRLATKLAEATEGPVKEVADRLRSISGTGKPLAVARLRGGSWRDDGWARLPSQAAIICSTVDQIGSALLFRAYGHSDRTASIYAGLAAHDSLILLDEAHCAVPFLQTLRAIARFRDEGWAAQPLKTSFRFSIMSATIPTGIPENVTFPNPGERATALDHPLLHQRFNAYKAAELKPVNGIGDEFVAEASNRACKFIEDSGKRRVAIMVNRVATAEQIARHLRSKLRETAPVVLLTGRMRPLDRDVLVKKWEPVLKAGSTETPATPVIVVTTQCLEVGADFSFDALVTECASLDALRQRFGRLNRLGNQGESPAVILIRMQDTKKPEEGDHDPIYGNAIYETWKWLNEPGHCEASITVNFGIAEMNARVNSLRENDEERFKGLLAPTPDAPILLPAHLDLLCQTSPRPVPEPDVSLFLHGKDRGRPDVRVVVRADLPETANIGEAGWIETLSLVPPTSPEMLTVPLYQLRRWLVEGPLDNDPGGDVEGTREAADGVTQSAHIPFLLWRGRDRSKITRDPNRIRPNDVVVLQLTCRGLEGLGQTIEEPEGLGKGRLDFAEHALRQARGRVMLRLQGDVLAPLRDNASIARLLTLAAMPEIGREEIEEIKEALRSALDDNTGTADAPEEISAPQLPYWLKETIKKLLDDGFRVENHPLGGLILIGNKERRVADEIEDDPLADEEDFRSKWRTAVTLKDHTADVCSVAKDFVTRCLPEQFAEAFIAAAKSHDLGKLDRRFQLLLRDDDEVAVQSEDPLAKSARLPEGRQRRNQDLEDANLPKGFRHEFFSMQLAEHFDLTPNDDMERNLTLHLIASHHGYARPFAPIVPDPLIAKGEAGNLSLSGIGVDTILTATERQKLPVTHRLDSGVPDRFWELTRRYGWWGLAYLETIFRLADWEASRIPGRAEPDSLHITAALHGCRSHQCSTLMLNALDGANPLAFLVALGTVRTLARAWPDKHLSVGWRIDAACWHPVIRAEHLPSDSGDARRFICDALARTLKVGFKPEQQAVADSNSSQKTFEAARRAVRDKQKEIREKGLRVRIPKQATETEVGLLIQDMQAKRLIWLSKLRSAVPSLEMALGKRINVPPEEFREFCLSAVESEDRWILDQLAHFGSDACLDRKKREVKPTPFSFVNGSGHQYFLKTASELVSSVTWEKIFAMLFEPWRPSDKKLSMRWNPSEDRRYALMAEDPTASGNEPKTIWAANLLGYVGLGLLPSAPTLRDLGTVAIANGRRNPVFTWPLWRAFLSPASVCSLLALQDLTNDLLPHDVLNMMGIDAVFRSERIEVGDGANVKLNFTPSRAL